MEVQDHPNPDEVTEESQVEEQPVGVRAVPGESYPIRMLHYQNGMLIIGYVISVFPETTMLLRPHIVDILADEEDNVLEYEFTPYLDQMVHYDPQDLIPIPFMNGAAMSLVRPAEHVIRNFSDFIRLKERLANKPDMEQVELFKRSYLNPRTKH